MGLSYPKTIVYQNTEIIVFSDTENKELYYYQFLQPAIATSEGIPVIQLYMYRSFKNISGGYFSIDIDLPIRENVLEQVQQELQERTNQQNLELRPLQINLLSRVHIDFIDMYSNLNQQNYFLKQTESSIYRPSGYGGNRVTFGFSLEQYEAVLLKKCLEERKLPIGITYELGYNCQKESYAFKVSVDWSSVLQYFEESLTLNLIVFSAEISKIYQSLITNKIIQIEKIEDDPKTDGFNTDRVGFEQEIIAFITQNFFTPIAIPKDNEKPTLGYVYKKESLTDIQEKFVTFTSSETKVTNAFIYPQIFLSDMLPQESMNYIHYIDLDGGDQTKHWFSLLTNANFKQDQIDYIEVTLYGRDTIPKVIQLKESFKGMKMQFTGKSIPFEKYSYTVFFKNTFPNWSSKVQSSVSKISANIVIINPAELYVIKRIEFLVPSKSIWKMYRKIVIEAYWEENTLPEISEILDLSKPSFIWTCLRENIQSENYFYQIYYFPLDGGPYIKSEQFNTSEEYIKIIAP